MKRIGLVGAALVLGALVSVPAKADVSVILWKTSKICQLWDNAPGNKPWPDDYAVVATLPTWDAAWAAMNTMYTEKKCGF